MFISVSNELLFYKNHIVLAVEQNNAKPVKKLLEKGANPSFSLLHTSVLEIVKQLGNKEIEELLVQYGDREFTFNIEKKVIQKGIINRCCGFCGNCALCLI